MVARWKSLLLVLASAVAVAQNDDAQRAAQEAQTKEKLEQVRAEIKTISAAAVAIQAQRSDQVTALRDQELKIAMLTKALRGVEQKLSSQQNDLNKLEQQRAGLNQKLEVQHEALAALLRSAYAAGRNEELKLWLAQDDAKTISRVLTYHRYFQTAQMDQISAVLSNLAQLAKIQTEIEEQTATLTETREMHAKQITELSADRKQREQVLAELMARLKDQQSRLLALDKDEKGLVDLLEKLRDVFADIPKQIAGAEPFAQLRGRLDWPLRGSVKTLFGGSDDNGSNSQGLLIEAKSGSDVRAVSHGRVAFADWLRGFGLLLIIDHGDGYLTLYGYNETLLKDVGDWVNANDVIASSGASGGTKTPGVYFELRYHGKPLNPRPWLKPAPAKPSLR